MKVHFSPCLDSKKVMKISQYLPATYAALNKLAPWMKGKWPSKVRCMSDSEIVDGRSRGAGHGFTIVNGRGEIWLNRHMSWQGYLLVLIHESLHNSHPDASEAEVNCVLVPHIYQAVFGKKLTPAMGRAHGLGAPVPGLGDRSYCR